MIVDKARPRCDCFAWNGKECQGTSMTCDSRYECAFYKTMSAHVESCNSSYKRISKLSEKQQLLISDKYFGGTMPWRDE